MTQLSACLIVKNESLFLSRCLESIRSFVDEIIVVDTGSDDNSVKIARSYDARVYHFAWTDDFSAARNESLRHATGDWILYIDADETIDTAHAAMIRQVITRKDITAVTVRQRVPQQAGNVATAFYSEYCRLFRRHASIRFEGKIHEQILPAIERQGGKVLCTDIVIHHWAYAASEEKKRRRAERNLHYLLTELEQARDDPFLYFNLGMTYRELGQRDAAIRSLHYALEKDDGCIKRKLIGQTHLNLAKLYLESGDVSIAARHARMVATFDPENPLSDYMLAALAVEEKQFTKAILHLEGALRMARAEAGVFPSVELNLARIYLELGSCRCAAGDFLNAECDFTRSVNIDPSVALSYLLLGNCRFMRGDLAGAAEMFKCALSLDPLLEEAHKGLVLCHQYE